MSSSESVALNITLTKKIEPLNIDQRWVCLSPDTENWMTKKHIPKSLNNWRRWILAKLFLKLVAIRILGGHVATLVRSQMDDSIQPHDFCNTMSVLRLTSSSLYLKVVLHPHPLHFGTLLFPMVDILFTRSWRTKRTKKVSEQTIFFHSKKWLGPIHACRVDIVFLNSR